MSDLVVIAFPTEAKAEEVRQKLLAMQKEYLIRIGRRRDCSEGRQGAHQVEPDAQHDCRRGGIRYLLGYIDRCRYLVLRSVLPPALSAAP
jgi:hypothetical protein